MTRPAFYPSSPAAAKAAGPVWEGYAYGFLGVLVFSLTLPMTRLAVAELDPLLIGLGRALVAAVPAVALLWLTRARRPNREEWPGVILAALGIVVGWPLASSFAMQTVPSSHGAVFNGLLPLSTAAFAALRSGERPSPAFWAWALLGAALVTAYALRQGHGTLSLGDLWLLVAVVLGGMGYAEGARASRTLGGGRTICWALVISAPVVAAPVGWMAAQASWPSPSVVLACAYLAFGSMFLGFFAWYRGLAVGGIARVGQVQLLQPFLTVVAAAALFDESVETATFFFAAAVIVVIAGGRRAIVRTPK
ncbi:transporter [Achromobacter sp. HZ01]|uniref:EamA family transporter n=1 Tax=Achromobacter pulmonis TaxID=1389932 RepID=A0A2N8KAQ9_9BURK|nr:MULTISPECIES: DMT family transporter [Achromobacter]PND30537.1 EamA family transporter [Achromobacter pulmonis]RAP60586.1 transporter [Achromobacter sp. HZ01]